MADEEPSITPEPEFGLNAELEDEQQEGADEPLPEEGSPLTEDPRVLAEGLIKRYTAAGSINYIAINIGNTGDVIGFVGRDAVRTPAEASSSAAESVLSIEDFFAEHPDDAPLMAAAAFLPSVTGEHVFLASQQLSDLMGSGDSIQPLSNPRRLALARIGARLERGKVVFDDVLRGQQARACLWREFSPSQRSKIASWLRQLGLSPRIEVASSVGTAVGALAAHLTELEGEAGHDLSRLYSLVIDGWALKGSEARIALGQALTVGTEKQPNAQAYLRARLADWTRPGSSRRNRTRAANVCVSAWLATDLETAFLTLKKLEATGRDEYFYRSQDAINTTWIGASIYRDTQLGLAERLVLYLSSWREGDSQVFHRTPQLHFAFAVQEELKSLRGGRLPLAFAMSDSLSIDAMADLVAAGLSQAEAAPIVQDMLVDLSRYARANGQVDKLQDFYGRIARSIEAIAPSPNFETAGFVNQRSDGGAPNVFPGLLKSGINVISREFSGSRRNLTLGPGIFEDTLALNDSVAIEGRDGAFFLGDIRVTGRGTEVALSNIVIRGHIFVGEGASLKLSGCRLELTSGMPLLRVEGACLKADNCSIVSQASIAASISAGSNVVFQKCVFASAGSEDASFVCSDATVVCSDCNLANIGNGPTLIVRGQSELKLAGGEVTSKHTALSIESGGSADIQGTTLFGGERKDSSVCLVRGPAKVRLDNVGIGSAGAPLVWICDGADVRLTDSLLQNARGAGIVVAGKASLSAVGSHIEQTGAEALFVAEGDVTYRNSRLSGRGQSSSVVVAGQSSLTLEHADVTGAKGGVYIGAGARFRMAAGSVHNCGGDGVIVNSGAEAHLEQVALIENKKRGLIAKEGATCRMLSCKARSNSEGNVFAEQGAILLGDCD